MIFDLDQTLIDSRIAKDLRKKRDWGNVYKLIPSFRLYDGIYELLNEIHRNMIKMAIVTSSPRPYCERVIRYFSLPIDVCVCYHDTNKHKPNPDPIILAANELHAKALDNVISFGDEANDIIASNSANVFSVACTWGSDNISNLLSANPRYICKTVQDMGDFLDSIKS